MRRARGARRLFYAASARAVGGALALALACGAGCAGADRSSERDAGTDGPIDATLGPHDPRDAAADGAPPCPTDAGPNGEYGRFDPATGAPYDSCFNGTDDDADGPADCDDRSCRLNVPACCVGASDEACCAAGTPAPLPIASCEGDVSACADLLAVAEPFGAPSPSIGAYGEDGARALVPRGASSDSGLLLREEIDARTHAVRLAARIRWNGAAHAEGSDAVGVALVHDAAPIVAPLAGFVVSGNRGEVALVVADEIVHREALTSALAELELEARPSGAIELRLNGSAIATSTLPLAQPVRAVVYGRTFNPTPTSPSPVRVEALSVRRDACDVPTGLGAGAVIFPPDDPAWQLVRRVASPSVARWVGADGVAEARMALEIDGAIHLARPQGSAWALADAVGAPALVGEAPWAERVGDPALRWNGEALELWFTGYANGVGTVARVSAQEGSDTFAWEDVEVVLAPGEGESFAQPAPFTADAASYLVVRERVGGEEALVLHRSDASGWSRVGVVRAPSAGDVAAFDRDEVASPRVVRNGDVYRLYFAGRRGLRWSVGMLVSPDGRTWVEPHGGALVRGPSGAGFDALGVTDPEPVIDGDVLELYYTGLDGDRARIGVASGAAPPAR